MFFVEIVASIVSQSVSLRADALDFLGDAANYALALAVVGLALRWRAMAALGKGTVMGAFGLWGAARTIHYAGPGTVPAAQIIGAVRFIALAPNLTIAAPLYRFRQNGSQAPSG